MTRADLEALVRRCESEPASRELDAAIQMIALRAETIVYDSSDEPYIRGESLVRVPAYTSSLDAAVSLVPEGWVELAGRDARGRGCAEVENIAHVGNERIWTYAKTPALALCAAALRARAMEAA